MFWNFKNSKDDSVNIELRISGEIVDDGSAWLYEWLDIPASSPNNFRQELEKYSGKNIDVWIDSWGGDVTAAAGIYNALKEHKGTVNVKIDGKAVSAASVIAMAGDNIQMSPVGFMMIHNPWTNVSGEAKDMRKVADTLDVIKDTIMNAYQLKTGKSRDEISKMMDDETYMSAQTAKNEGFINEILYVDDKQSTNIENSFNFNRLSIQNSASSSVRKFIENNKEKLQKEGAKNMIETVQDLQKEYPDLVNQITETGIKNERARISELDALNDGSPAVADIISEAKNSGKKAAEIKAFVDICKKHNTSKEPATENKGAEQFKNIIIDNKKSGADNILGNADGNDSSANDAADMAFMANAINKKLGVK